MPAARTRARPVLRQRHNNRGRERASRRWIGIDQNRTAIELLQERLRTDFESEPNRDYAVVGEPSVPATKRRRKAVSRAVRSRR